MTRIEASQLGDGIKESPAESPATWLDDVARAFQALSHQLDVLSRRDGADDGQFVHLDMAARNALAAACAIDSVNGTVAVPAEHAHTPESEDADGQIAPEFASGLIRRVFTAVIELTALQSILGDTPLGGKAGAIVEELDCIIRDIRDAARSSG